MYEYYNSVVVTVVFIIECSHKEPNYVIITTSLQYYRDY